MKKLGFFIIIFFISNICFAKEIQLDNETKKICKQTFKNIYNDIAKIKNKYLQLQNLNKSVWTCDRESGICGIRYEYDIKELKKVGGKFGSTAFSFTLQMTPLDEHWQAMNMFGDLTFSNLGFKLYGFFVQPQSQDQKPKQAAFQLTKDITEIIRKNVQLIKKLDEIYDSDEKISKEDALKIAERECLKEGWEWVDINITDNNSYWDIITHKNRLGMNGFIRIDKENGEVIDKHITGP